MAGVISTVPFPQMERVSTKDDSGGYSLMSHVSQNVRSELSHQTAVGRGRCVPPLVWLYKKRRLEGYVVTGAAFPPSGAPSCCVER